MYPHTIRTPGQVKRVGKFTPKEGSRYMYDVTMTDVVGCSVSDDLRGGTIGTNPKGEDVRAYVSSEPATTVWITSGWNADNLDNYTAVFLCKKHTGTLRGLKTRGTRGYDSYHQVETATVDEVAADPFTFIQQDYDAVQAEKVRIAQAREDRIAASRDKVRANFFEGKREYGQTVSTAVRLAEADEYGRVFISPRLDGHLTPVEAREAAAKLIEAADEAERLSKEA